MTHSVAQHTHPSDPPSTLQKIHAAHKARQARLNPALPKSAPVNVPITDDERIAELESRVCNLTDALSNAMDAIAELGGKVALIAKHQAEVSPFFTEIVDAICEFYGVTKLDLFSTRRTWNLARPRQIAAYLGRKLTGLSLPQIGARLGGRDHTTILHGANKIALAIKSDEQLARDAEALEVRIAEKVIARQKTLRGQS